MLPESRHFYFALTDRRSLRRQFTEDLMYFGYGATIPDELALKRPEAQRLRVEQNRNIACSECLLGGTAVGEDVAA